MGPDLAPSARRDLARSASRRLDVGFLLHVVLQLLGFLATTMLLTWGLFVLLFLALGDLSLDGLMNELNNLTSRYVHADPARIASFKAMLLCAQLLLAASVTFFRRHHLLPRNCQRSPNHA